MVAVTWLAPGLLLTERYRLVNRVAAGGMGEVWCATDTRLVRDVAVKVLRSELSDDPEFRRRFLLEAQITAALNAPSIAAVYDYGETVLGVDGAGPNVTYLVMELVDGEPLSAVLARQPRMPADRVLDVLEQAGNALDVAHQRGLVHRDVKPANILITADGRVKLTDFGIARALAAATVTSTGMVIGTAQYMSPEQAAGQKAGTASDVYSLGVVGYQALAGRRPFEGESAVALAVQHLRDTPPPLPDDVPAGVRALIEVALVKDPHLRYSTGGEFAYAAAAVRGGRALPPPPGVTQGTAQVRPAAAMVASGPTAVVVPAARRSDASDVEGGRGRGAPPVDALTDMPKPPAPVPAPAVSPTKPSMSSTATASPPERGRRRPARRAVLVGVLGLIAVLLGVVGVLAARGAGTAPTGADAPADAPPTVAPSLPSGDTPPDLGDPADAEAPSRPDDLPGGAASGPDGDPGGAPGGGAEAARTDPRPGSGSAGSGGAGSGGVGSGAGPTEPRSGSGRTGSGAAGPGGAGSGGAESGRTGSGTGDSGGGSAVTGGATGGTEGPGTATRGGATGGATGGRMTPAPTGDTDDDEDDDKDDGETGSE